MIRTEKGGNGVTGLVSQDTYSENLRQINSTKGRIRVEDRESSVGKKESRPED